MDKIEKWMENEWKWTEILGLGAIIIISTLACCIIIGQIINLFGGALQPRIPNNSELGFVMFAMAILVPIEELLFRLPLALVVRFTRNPNKVIWWVIGLSIAFGLYHGSTLNIPIQGMVGMVLSTVFLKTGGWNKKIIRPFLWTCIVHYTFNTLLIVLMIAS